MNKEIKNDLKDKKNEIKLNEQKDLEFYHFLKEHGCILFETVVGSHAHGTSTKDSDVDKAFVYILPQEYIYGTNYIPQLKVNKDYVGFEIKRFLELVKKNNPTIIELFYSPEDCIITKHPVFLQVIGLRNKILTKICKNSFAGYAKMQIKKAKGLDKMQNWEIDRVKKKWPIDFCYVIDKAGYGTIPLKYFLNDSKMEQKFCGISKIPNARDVYALFYDQKAHSCFSELEEKNTNEEKKKYYKEIGESVGLGYKGVTKTNVGESLSESNQLRLSSIPKGEKVIATLIYNKDSYTKSCKDYKSYQTWLKNRNEQRYIDVKEHGQSYDGKNLMHCKRLIQIAREIAETGTVTIRRPNIEELLDIRRGKVELKGFIEWAEKEMNELSILFDNSELPNEVDSELINKTLIQVRKDFYTKAWESWSGWTDGSIQKINKFVECHDGLTEFQTMLRSWFMKILPNPYYCGINDKKIGLISHDETDIIEKCYHDGYDNVRIVDVIPWKRNPQYTSENGKKFDIEFENMYIFELSEDKLTLGGGGDWKNSGAIFDLVKHEEGFTTINERNDKDEWDKERYEIGDLFDWLDIQIKLKKEE